MNYINWLYFAQNTQQQQKKLFFLYGLALPTQETKVIAPIIYNKKIIGKNNKLYCLQVITDGPLNTETRLDFTDILNLEEFSDLKDLASAPIIVYNKKTLQVSGEVNRNIPRSILSIPLPMHTFFTDDFNRYYDEVTSKHDDNDFLIKTIEILEKESKQPFKSCYSSRIGCYEIGETKEWSEFITSPCYIETKPNRDLMIRPYILKKHEKFISECFTLHLIIYNDKEEIIYDGINTIKENEAELFICEINPEDDSSIDYWIYDKDNNLIARDKNLYIKQIGLNIGVLGDTYTLPSNTFSRNGALSKQDHTVSTVHYNNSTIEFTKEVKHNTDVLNSLIHKHYNKDSSATGKFFTKKKDDAFKDIIYFLDDITKHDSYKIIFIDPFISSNASLDYLKFFQNSQINIQLISCWDKTISPDGKECTSIDESVEETCKILDSIQDYKISLRSATWFNLKPNKFHDRYIYLQNTKDGKTSLYSISNSLNNILNNYENLLIFPLAESVKHDAIKYIETLIQLCNETTQVYPRIKQ